MIGNSQTIEIIPRRLFWCSDKAPPVNPKIHSFSIDESLVYLPYNRDFGPLDLSKISKYCKTLTNLLSDKKYLKVFIYHYTSLVPAKRANSAFLMCAYQMLVLNKSAEESWAPFEPLPRFLPFRDASSEGGSFDLTILDCLKALQRAKNLNWYNLNSFNTEEYDYYNEPQNGGFNWIIPSKFLAFANPSKPRSLGLTVDQFIEVFKDLQITAIIRLNSATYNPSKFIDSGLNHYDLYYHDGSVPDESLIDAFFNISEKEGPIAIHCQAGLGRTATLIGCYAIKHFGFNGPESIAWARLCRPGSVLGPQQQFLCEFYEKTQGVNKEKKNFMTLYEKFQSKHGDLGQGLRLSSQFVREPKNLSERNFTPLKYKTKFNHLVSIDPMLMKLYGKSNK